MTLLLLLASSQRVYSLRLQTQPPPCLESRSLPLLWDRPSTNRHLTRGPSLTRPRRHMDPTCLFRLPQHIKVKRYLLQRNRDPDRLQPLLQDQLAPGVAANLKLMLLPLVSIASERISVAMSTGLADAAWRLANRYVVLDDL